MQLAFEEQEELLATSPSSTHRLPFESSTPRVISIVAEAGQKSSGPARGSAVLFITNCSSRHMGAFGIALAQYKLGKPASKLADAIKLLELVIELDLIYIIVTTALLRKRTGSSAFSSNPLLSVIQFREVECADGMALEAAK